MLAMLFARRRVKEDANLIYRVLATENVGEEKKAGKGIAVMTIETIESPKRSSGSAEPMTGPVDPGASALTAQEKAYPSFTDPGAVAAIAGGYHSTPFDILGIHPHTVDGKPAIVIRTFQPQALTVSVLRGDQAYPMRQVHQDGFFEAIFDQSEFFPYRLSITLPALDGGRRQTYEIDDPYRYPPVLTDFDLHLFGFRGRNRRRKCFRATAT